MSTQPPPGEPTPQQPPQEAPPRMPDELNPGGGGDFDRPDVVPPEEPGAPGKDPGSL